MVEWVLRGPTKILDDEAQKWESKEKPMQYHPSYQTSPFDYAQCHAPMSFCEWWVYSSDDQTDVKTPNISDADP